MKFGLVRSTPDDERVIEKFICHSYRSARTRGRAWKRKYPDQIVRIVSLIPGDTSIPEEVGLVLLYHQQERV